MLILKSLIFAVALAVSVNGHGRLMEPPNRSSLWRVGYAAPANYDDNQLYCGGYSDQWNNNGGKCGICGDPYEQPQPRDNEAGGTYGLGIIVRNYTMGQTIDVWVDLTVNHNGWFEFRLCPNNDIHKIATQECLNEYLLELEEGGTRWYLPAGFPSTGDIYLKFKLPPNLTCSQCVMQWHYNTATTWGTCDDGTQAMGCGPQECFRGCADVMII
ncbi:hypothetical protein CHUAL_007249 [Chamberlinius hualienensis]